MTEENLIRYKAPLAEIPVGAYHYAELARKLKDYTRDWKKARRANQPDNVIQAIMQRIRQTEIAMEKHSNEYREKSDDK